LKRVALTLGGALVLLAAVVIGRGLSATSRQVQVEPAPPIDLDAERAAETLAAAIRFATVSNQDPAQFDASQFSGLRAFLEERFPRVHHSLTREVINEHSLLYRWEGRGDGKPIVLLAHQDVVPVEGGTEDKWEQPPFSGAIADGFVWGRGTLDDKSSALAILEAVEYLLGTGFQPTRTVYLAFGHDEEVSGRRGAQVMAATLRARGVDAELVLDEGAVLQGLVPGIAEPVAAVGIGEKGYVSIELVSSDSGGHSSVPPPRTAIGALSAAIERLERHQMPATLSTVTGQGLAFIAPEMPLGRRIVLSNLWLFGPLVERQMARSPQTNAAIRTTTAPTIFEAGVKENILPATARAVVNFRILPGDTVETVLEHVRRTIDDDGIAVRTLGEGNDPPPQSDPDAPAFTRLAGAIRAAFPGTVVAPMLSVGATDARYYTVISRNVYRFAPIHLRPEDLGRIHGTNERIAIADYAGMIRFYVGLLRTSAGG
jgi:carboxypeptidase PM20D1